MFQIKEYKKLNSFEELNIINDKEHSIIPDPMFDPLNETIILASVFLSNKDFKK